MLVSIIIPIYKVEPYIIRCIDSVLHQTYRNIEVILVDDCTPDKSMQVAIDYIEKSPHGKDLKFIYLHHDHNRGLSAARNTGIDAATGDYLFFLDSDDYIFKDCISHLIETANKFPMAEVIYAGAKSNLKDYDWMSFEKKNLPDYTEDKNWINKALLSRITLNMTAWNKLVKCNFIKENRLYFAEGLVNEDEIWNYDMAKHVSRAAICKHDTYMYVIRRGSITNNLSNRYNNILNLINYFSDNVTTPFRSRQISYIFNFIKKHPLPKDYARDLKKIEGKMIKKSRSKQKIALWIYYNAPKRILKNQHILHKLLNAIGTV